MNDIYIYIVFFTIMRLMTTNNNSCLINQNSFLKKKRVDNKRIHIRTWQQRKQ